jgi:hypothetical protein
LKGLDDSLLLRFEQPREIIAAKDIAVKKYVVRLRAQEREQLHAIPQGQRPGGTAAEGAHSPKGRCLEKSRFATAAARCPI